MSEDHALKANSLSSETLAAIQHLSDTVQTEHGTQNGQTALYWHILHTVSDHIVLDRAPASPEALERMREFAEAQGLKSL